MQRSSEDPWPNLPGPRNQQTSDRAPGESLRTNIPNRSAETGHERQHLRRSPDWDALLSNAHARGWSRHVRVGPHDGLDQLLHGRHGERRDVERSMPSNDARVHLHEWLREVMPVSLLDGSQLPTFAPNAHGSKNPTLDGWPQPCRAVRLHRRHSERRG